MTTTLDGFEERATALLADIQAASAGYRRGELVDDLVIRTLERISDRLDTVPPPAGLAHVVSSVVRALKSKRRPAAGKKAAIRTARAHPRPPVTPEKAKPSGPKRVCYQLSGSTEWQSCASVRALVDRFDISDKYKSVNKFLAKSPRGIVTLTIDNADVKVRYA